MNVEVVGGPLDGKVFAVPDNTDHLHLAEAPELTAMAVEDGEDGVSVIAETYEFNEYVLPIERVAGKFVVYWHHH